MPFRFLLYYNDTYNDETQFAKVFGFNNFLTIIEKNEIDYHPGQDRCEKNIVYVYSTFLTHIFGQKKLFVLKKRTFSVYICQKEVKHISWTLFAHVLKMLIERKCI